MKGNLIRINKFKFSNNELAFKVRQNMHSALTPFDDNKNGLFQQPQIIKALIYILDENQNQIKYVISNVFRYDKDNDHAVTYEQFVNFAVQQHFGQMAIQRLHRNQVYSRGKQRLMNLNEFQITLNQSLKHIQSTGSRQQYEQLFAEVDLDLDGWIKYQDYFMFLRQYFGSLSVAAEKQEAAKATKLEASQVQPYKGIIDYPQERFSRLIYTQFKVVVMQYDVSKSLILRKQQISSILQNLFSIPVHELEQIIRLILATETQIQYEKFMKIIVPFYFCEYDIQKNNINQVDQDNFVNFVRRACVFVRVKPSQIILREVFKRADNKRKGILDINEYINTLGSIFQTYKFDTRGTGNLYINNL